MFCVVFPDFSLTFPVCSKFPDFSLTGKCLPIFPGFPGFPVRVGTLSVCLLRPGGNLLEHTDTLFDSLAPLLHVVSRNSSFLFVPHVADQCAKRLFHLIHLRYEGDTRKRQMYSTYQVSSRGADDSRCARCTRSAACSRHTPRRTRHHRSRTLPAKRDRQHFIATPSEIFSLPLGLNRP